MTKIFAETDRLILRELVSADAGGMFELDADPEVHRFLGNHTVHLLSESAAAIEAIRQQYTDNGIGRWAVLEKTTDSFIGWGGLKLIKEPVNKHVNYYDMGYRLIKRYWGKGYASEIAAVTLTYGFEELNLNEICAMVHIDNGASRHVLEKAGLHFVNKFYYGSDEHDWLKIHRAEWLNKFI